jgi:hypothetical protein
VESLFTTNAIPSKSNAELVASARKPKDKKRLPTTARWLTIKDAEELRAKQKAKEDAEIARKSAATARKEQIDVRKAQVALDRSERQSAREFKEEYARLAKIHKNYFK